MIDEFFQKAAPQVGRATADAAKNTGNAVSNAFASFFSWFDSFRWIEFTTAITAAFAAGLALSGSLHISEPAAHSVAYFGATVTAIAFIRSPKTKWEKTDTVDAEDEVHDTSALEQWREKSNVYRATKAKATSE